MAPVSSGHWLLLRRDWEVWRIHSWELPVVRLLILNGCFKEQFLGMARTSALQHFY
jgi:hypothetical protein